MDEVMSKWKRIALETIRPDSEIQTIIQEAKRPSSLWVDIWHRFEKSHTRRGRSAFIASVYEYALWCVTQSESLKVQIPTLDLFYKRVLSNASTRRKMPRFLSFEDFLELKPSFEFSALGITETQYEEFIHNYQEQALLLTAKASPIASGNIPKGFIQTLEIKVAELANPWIEDCQICQQLNKPLGADIYAGESLPTEAYQLKVAYEWQDWSRQSLLASTEFLLRCPFCGTFYYYSYDYEFSPGGSYEYEFLKPSTAAERIEFCRSYPSRYGQ